MRIIEERPLSSGIAATPTDEGFRGICEEWEGAQWQWDGIRSSEKNVQPTPPKA